MPMAQATKPLFHPSHNPVLAHLCDGSKRSSVPLLIGIVTLCRFEGVALLSWLLRSGEESPATTFRCNRRQRLAHGTRDNALSHNLSLQLTVSLAIVEHVRFRLAERWASPPPPSCGGPLLPTSPNRIPNPMENAMSNRTYSKTSSGLQGDLLSGQWTSKTPKRGDGQHIRLKSLVDNEPVAMPGMADFSGAGPARARIVGTALTSVTRSPCRPAATPSRRRRQAARYGRSEWDMPPLHRGATFGCAAVASTSRNRRTQRPDASSSTAPARAIGSKTCQRIFERGCAAHMTASWRAEIRLTQRPTKANRHEARGRRPHGRMDHPRHAADLYETPPRLGDAPGIARGAECWPRGDCRGAAPARGAGPSIGPVRPCGRTDPWDRDRRRLSVHDLYVRLLLHRDEPAVQRRRSSCTPCARSSVGRRHARRPVAPELDSRKGTRRSPEALSYRNYRRPSQDAATGCAGSRPQRHDGFLLVHHEPRGCYQRHAPDPRVAACRR